MLRNILVHGSDRIARDSHAACQKSVTSLFFRRVCPQPPAYQPPAQPLCALFLDMTPLVCHRISPQNDEGWKQSP